MDNPDRFIALIDELAALGHELPRAISRGSRGSPSSIYSYS
jgi:hypothetical protein